jgi:hypothetical protein
VSCIEIVLYLYFIGEGALVAFEFDELVKKAAGGGVSSLEVQCQRFAIAEVFLQQLVVEVVEEPVLLEHQY